MSETRKNEVETDLRTLGDLKLTVSDDRKNFLVLEFDFSVHAMGIGHLVHVFGKFPAEENFLAKDALVRNIGGAPSND